MPLLIRNLLVFLLGWSTLLPACASAAELALAGAWRPSDAGESATSVRRGDARLQSFDPTRLKVFSGGENGSWVLLWPENGRWPDAPWVLEARSPGLQTLTFYPPGADAPVSAALLRPQANEWPGHGRVVFPVRTAPAGGEPLRLHVDARGVIASTMTFAVLPVAEHLRADAWWLMFASACLAIMAAMAVVALFFAQRLRDPAFLFYSVFGFSYALILALQTGYVSDPLGWHAPIAAWRTLGRIATASSVVFAILFLDRFANLRRYFPRGRRLLLAYAAAVGALAALGLVPIEAANALGRTLVNPLLILGGPLVLLVAAAAAAAGSRYAAFFLIGWTVLLLTTVLGSLQLYGFAPHWTWSDEAALAAGAFDALVLSLGLADRSLALRRDRDHARRLADIDALTGLYNRRAWTDRLLRLEERLQRKGQALSVLFLDLDRFKELNDALGHEAGDAALRVLARVMREELRDEDLIGRYGGEEFVVALPGADRALATRIAERIRQRLQDMANADPARAMRTVSIGVATSSEGADSALLIKRADGAMYAAKAAGRNRVMHAA